MSDKHFPAYNEYQYAKNNRICTQELQRIRKEYNATGTLSDADIPPVKKRHWFYLD